SALRPPRIGTSRGMSRLRPNTSCFCRLMASTRPTSNTTSARTRPPHWRSCPATEWSSPASRRQSPPTHSRGWSPRLQAATPPAQASTTTTPGIMPCCRPAPPAAPGSPPGLEVTYFEQLDKNQHSIDAGQGLSGLPSSILQMTGAPGTLIDATQLPVDPLSCKPVYPHSYLKVNTIFEVARTAGLRTAWSDKH